MLHGAHGAPYGIVILAKARIHLAASSIFLAEYRSKQWIPAKNMQAWRKPDSSETKTWLTIIQADKATQKYAVNL